MKVTLKLVGGLVHTLGFSEREIETPPGTTVGELLDAIGVDRTRPVIVGRNGCGRRNGRGGFGEDAGIRRLGSIRRRRWRERRGR